MIRSSRQLKDRIRNLASDKSADAQVLLRSYMMERLLERISDSSYRDKFILKGGMLVASMVGFQARSTMDIDTTVSGETISIPDVQRIIEEVSRIDLPDGVSFTINNVSEIMDEAEYPGVRVAMTAYMDGVKVHLKVDISTGDVITPHAIEYSYKLMLEDRTINLLAYNLETILAEKLETIISRTTTNTRMRDFYDVYVLLKLYRDAVDPAVLSDALSATAGKRGSVALLGHTEKVLTDLYDSRDMSALWKNYSSKFNYAESISWDTVLCSVREVAAIAQLNVRK